MPYSSNKELPKQVRDKLSDKKQSKFREVVNSMLADGKSEEQAFRGAWSHVKKYMPEKDVFPNAASARSRSMDLGMGGEIHTYEVDGQAYYMPGSSHEEYLSYYQQMSDEKPEENEESGETEITVNINIMKQEVNKSLQADIIKADEEERIVWGWAYVSTVNGDLSRDLSGDTVRPEELVKAATNFMLDVRVAKAMHEGNKVGEVVHSMPLTKELGQNLGVQSDKEGWIICMKIHDNEVWSKVKSGEYSAFSIGGRALRESLDG